MIFFLEMSDIPIAKIPIFDFKCFKIKAMIGTTFKWTLVFYCFVGDI